MNSLNKIQEAGKRGRFFSLEFIKRSNGKIRRMNCRLGVTKHLKGGTLKYNPTEHNLITVFDTVCRDYRSVPLENVLRVNGEPVS